MALRSVALVMACRAVTVSRRVAHSLPMLQRITLAQSRTAKAAWAATGASAGGGALRGYRPLPGPRVHGAAGTRGNRARREQDPRSAYRMLGVFGALAVGTLAARLWSLDEVSRRVTSCH